MSLEAVIAENTVALSRHTAAMEKLTALLESGAVASTQAEVIRQPEPEAPAKKPARAEKPKAEEPQVPPDSAWQPEETPAELTYEDVAALVGKACLVSRAKVKAILADYKAANLAGVPKGKWPEVKGRLAALIAEGA